MWVISIGGCKSALVAAPLGKGKPNHAGDHRITSSFQRGDISFSFGKAGQIG
jgi:hypothetical protein